MNNGSATVKPINGVRRRAASCPPYERLTHDLVHDPRVTQEIALGKRIGFYRLKGQLGTGNFARVKLGMHVLTNEKVAIKIIDKSKLDDASRRLLSREITCMECLDHPNIVRLFEVVENFQKLHLIMECASEGDLHARVTKAGPFSEEDGRRVFAQVVAAINHMHRKGVVHRDLKAENVFFISETQIKVGDFGFSIQQVDTALDTFCGSPPYAAPELFGEEKYSGPMVDIWAMGVLLYFLLSGNMPFLGENIPRLKEKIIAGNYHMPKSLTPACAELIAGILVKDAEVRYTMDDICSSWWLKGGESVTGTDDPRSIVVRNDESGLTASFNEGEAVDPEIQQWLEQIGVPTTEPDKLLGEPRNPIAGTYRILLHRKHLAGLKLLKAQQETRVPHGGSRPTRTMSLTHRNGKEGKRTGTTEKAAGSRERRSSQVCVIL